MKKTDLDTLPLYSPWPAWLLGKGEPTKLPSYEERYSALLRAYELDKLSPQALALAEVGDGRTTVVSLEDQLYLTVASKAQEMSDETLLQKLVSVVEASQARTVVDLGCGWGRMLIKLRRKLGDGIELRGADSSKSGVALAHALAKEHDAHVFTYDLAGGRKCQALVTAEEPAVVFTSFACHQLSTAYPVIAILERWREKIANVVHYEPVEEYFGKGLLGLLRTRYSERRGYSADVLGVVKGLEDKISYTLEPNVFGMNPYLPGSLLTWQWIES